MDFSQLSLPVEIMKSLEQLGYQSPTPVQAEVIPVLMKEKDVIVKSQTGSGKTAAFAIPVCAMASWEENKPQSLVIVPTRELAVQVQEEIFQIGRYLRIKAVAVYGKAPFDLQAQELKQKTHAVVGTPGRILDHLTQGTLDVSKVQLLVIDEADELLDMGFIDQIKGILDYLTQERTSVLLSATMPADIEKLCGEAMRDPVWVEIEEQNPALQRIKQISYRVEHKDKLRLLRDIAMVENPDSCIVFCNTKEAVDEAHNFLVQAGFSCGKLHGGMEQRDRLRMMDTFKQGLFRFLTATDVAARGIDIHQVSLIINYDIPRDSEQYVHRIGRTGRIGAEGKAISFAAPSEARFVEAIQHYIGAEISLEDRPSAEAVKLARPEFQSKNQAQPERKTAKGARLHQEITRLQIHAGKKQKMRTVDIVGTLCSMEGMTPEDIGIIQIADTAAFVEVLNNKGEQVYQELQTRPIKGSLRKVSKAKKSL